MILDPFFMVLAISHISHEHGKTMFAKNVYRHFQNVPLPCSCPLRFCTFFAPLFHQGVTPGGVTPRVTISDPI